MTVSAINCLHVQQQYRKSTKAAEQSDHFDALRKKARQFPATFGCCLRNTSRDFGGKACCLERIPGLPMTH
jgi:hypothetical protein